MRLLDRRILGGLIVLAGLLAAISGLQHWLVDLNISPKLQVMAIRQAAQTERMERSFVHLESRLAHLDDRFARLEGRFDRLGGRFGRLDNKFARLDGRFGRLDNKFDRLDGRFDRLASKFDRLDGRFDRLGGKFDDLASLILESRSRVKEPAIYDSSPLPRALRDAQAIYSQTPSSR